jgi:hypothetical protein
MDAGKTARGIAIDRDDARMWVRRAQEVGMQRARDRHVVEKSAAPGEEAPVFPSQKRTANDRVVAHAGPALRRRATAATKLSSENRARFMQHHR